MVSSDDGKKEDLSAYSREDLVYKAKLAEQAERCVNWTRLGLDAGTTTGRVARRRRAEASRVPDRARFDDDSADEAPVPIARSIDRARARSGTRSRATRRIDDCAIGMGGVGRGTLDES